MAVCTYCSEEMTDGVSCSVKVLHRDGAPFPVKRVYKRECCRVGERAGRCLDCGAPYRGYHHLGCDMQRCPRCTHQMISCGCWFDEDGASIADDEEMFLDWVSHRFEGFLDAS